MKQANLKDGQCGKHYFFYIHIVPCVPYICNGYLLKTFKIFYRGRFVNKKTCRRYCLKLEQSRQKVRSVLLFLLLFNCFHFLTDLYNRKEVSDSIQSMSEFYAIMRAWMGWPLHLKKIERKRSHEIFLGYSKY